MGRVTRRGGRGRRSSSNTQESKPFAHAGGNQTATAELNEEGKMTVTVRVDMSASTPSDEIDQYKLFDVVDGQSEEQPFDTVATDTAFVTREIGEHLIRVSVAKMIGGTAVESEQPAGPMDETRADVMKIIALAPTTVAFSGPRAIASEATPGALPAESTNVPVEFTVPEGSSVDEYIIHTGTREEFIAGEAEVTGNPTVLYRGAEPPESLQLEDGDYDLAAIAIDSAGTLSDETANSRQLITVTQRPVADAGPDRTVTDGTDESE